MALERVGIQAVSEGVGPYINSLKQMEQAELAAGRGAQSLATHSNTMGTALDTAQKKASPLPKILGDISKVAGGFVVAQGLMQLPNMFGSFISAASDAGENLNKVRVVFGDTAQEIEHFASSAAQNLGLSESAALSAAGTFGNLFTAMGIGTPKAAEMSKGILSLAADLASFNNIDPSVALDKLRAGLVGETEPLRTLGVNLNAVAIEAKAMEMGFEKVDGALSASAKAQASYALILEQTRSAQGDFERTSTGMANSTRIIKAQFEDIKVEIGNFFLPMVEKVVQRIAKDLPGAFEDAKRFISESNLPEFLKGIGGEAEIAAGGFLKFGEAVATHKEGLIAVGGVLAGWLIWAHPLAAAIAGIAFATGKMIEGFEIAGVKFGGVQSPTGERGLFGKETVEGNVAQLEKGLDLPNRILSALTPGFLQTDEWKEAERIFKEGGKVVGVNFADGVQVGLKEGFAKSDFDTILAPFAGNKAEATAIGEELGGAVAAGAITGVDDGLARADWDSTFAPFSGNEAEAKASGTNIGGAVASGFIDNFAQPVKSSAELTFNYVEGEGSLATHRLALAMADAAVDMSTSMATATAGMTNSMDEFARPTFENFRVLAEVASTASSGMEEDIATATAEMTRDFANWRNEIEGDFKDMSKAGADAWQHIEDEMARATAEMVSASDNATAEIVGDANEIADAWAGAAQSMQNDIASAVASAEQTMRNLAVSIQDLIGKAGELARATSVIGTGQVPVPQQTFPNPPAAAQSQEQLAANLQAGFDAGLLGYSDELGFYPLAKGGPATAGRPYLVGEQGAEIFVPRQSGYVIPADATAAVLGNRGGTNVNINGPISLPNVVDPQSFIAEIDRMQAKHLRLAERGLRG